MHRITPTKFLLVFVRFSLFSIVFCVNSDQSEQKVMTTKEIRCGKALIRLNVSKSVFDNPLNTAPQQCGHSTQVMRINSVKTVLMHNARLFSFLGVVRR